MRAAAAAVLIAVAGAAGAAQSPLTGSPTTFRPIEEVVPNRPGVRLPLYGGGGPLDRYAPDRDLGYALIALPLDSELPSLVLLDYDRRARVRARVLDRPPWANPRVALPVRLEPRRDMERGGRRLAGAWLALPDDVPPQEAFLLVEVSTGSLLVGLSDLAHASAWDPVASRWERAGQTSLASPLEADLRRTAQRLFPWPVEDAAPR